MTLSEEQARVAIEMLDLGIIVPGGSTTKWHMDPDEEVPQLQVNLGYRRPTSALADCAFVKNAGRLIDVLTQNKRFDVFADIPYGNASLADWLIHPLNNPEGRIRLVPVGMMDSTEYIYTGPTKPPAFIRGKTCLLIDDAVSDSKITFKAIHALERMGLKVLDVVALIDLGQGGKDALKKKHIRLTSVFTIEGILHYYWVQGLIGERRYNASMAQAHAAKI
jgi:orotate phosphoribosyltransferase